MSVIRKNTLTKNKTLYNFKPDATYDSLSRQNAMSRLGQLQEQECTATTPQEQVKSLERTQNWLMWHDHSGIANHGLMLFLLRELYDPAIHLSNKEYKAKNGYDVDVQSLVEEPKLYMMGFSSSTDEDQLMFVPTRNECLQGLSNTVQIDGIQIADKMRFMNGDNPSVEFEDGTQKGGHYGCSGCDGDMRRAGEYDYMAYRRYKSLDDKLKLVLDGKEGQRDKIHPFHKLKVEQLRIELRARKEDDSGLKPELQERLNNILGGTSKVPALLFGSNANCSLDDLNLKDYEVLFFEPLHCCLNHIAHILQELPHHVTDVDTLLTLNETKTLSLSKEKLRCTDYRKALLQVTLQLAKLVNVPDEVMELLLTFSEMMGIFYASEEKRTPRQVLRLFNLSFRHSLAVNSVLLPAKSMTTRKLQGIYYHQIIDHSALIYRIISLKSINAELFERFFDRIEDITKKTWSKHPDDLIPNTFLHVQAEDAFEDELTTMAKQEREISRLSKQLPLPTNTIIKGKILNNKSRLWQAHLQRIPDYLSPGPGQWWNWAEDGSVEFYDGPKAEDTKACGSSIQHFRSASIKSMQNKLDATWKHLYSSSPELLPVQKLRNEDGKLIYHKDRSINGNYYML